MTETLVQHVAESMQVHCGVKVFKGHCPLGPHPHEGHMRGKGRRLVRIPTLSERCRKAFAQR